MGGLTYLFGLVVNVFVATVIAGLAGLVLALLPTKRMIEGNIGDPVSKKKRASIGFISVWLLVMLYGCVGMFRPHHDELSSFEGAGIAVGLIDGEAQVMHAERVVHGDSAQSYVVVRTTAADVERVTRMMALKAGAYDGHTVRDRGWQAPDWWPNHACQDGVTYQVDPIDLSSTDLGYVINWCPSEGQAYVQRFDY